MFSRGVAGEKKDDVQGRQLADVVWEVPHACIRHWLPTNISLTQDNTHCRTMENDSDRASQICSLREWREKDDVYTRKIARRVSVGCALAHAGPRLAAPHLQHGTRARTCHHAHGIRLEGKTTVATELISSSPPKTLICYEFTMVRAVAVAVLSASEPRPAAHVLMIPSTRRCVCVLHFCMMWASAHARTRKKTQ